MTKARYTPCNQHDCLTRTGTFWISEFDHQWGLTPLSEHTGAHTPAGRLRRGAQHSKSPPCMHTCFIPISRCKVRVFRVSHTQHEEADLIHVQQIQKTRWEPQLQCDLSVIQGDVHVADSLPAPEQVTLCLLCTQQSSGHKHPIQKQEPSSGLSHSSQRGTRRQVRHRQQKTAEMNHSGGRQYKSPWQVVAPRSKPACVVSSKGLCRPATSNAGSQISVVPVLLDLLWE